MSHIKALSRRPAAAQEGELSSLESAIITLLTVFFGEWINGPQVINNLADFYSKTPE